MHVVEHQSSQEYYRIGKKKTDEGETGLNFSEHPKTYLISILRNSELSDGTGFYP